MIWKIYIPLISDKRDNTAKNNAQAEKLLNTEGNFVRNIHGKPLAFMVSAFYAAITWGIWAYYQGHVSSEDFDLMLSIDFVAIILIGGLGRMI